MACRDIDAFRSEVAGECTDYTASECHTAVRAAVRRHGRGCLREPIFAPEAPPFYDYLCTGPSDRRLHDVCPGASLAASSPAAPLDASRSPWRAAGAVGAAGAAGAVVTAGVLMGSRKFAQWRHEERHRRQSIYEHGLD